MLIKAKFLDFANYQTWEKIIYFLFKINSIKQLNYEKNEKKIYFFAFLSKKK